MEYYDIAAKWWADKIRNLSLSDFYLGDGDSSRTIASAAFYKNKKAVPGEKEISRFEEILSEKIKECVDKEKSILIETDYEPDGFLKEAATDAGIPLKVFPWRMVMFIEKDNVSVKNGPFSNYKTIA